MRKAKPTNPAMYAGINAKVPFLAPDAVTKVIPAPVDGWDAISPLAEMDPKRAPILQNWVPRPGYVELRGGSFPRALTMTGSPVETLMTYRNAFEQKLFAVSSGKFFDASVDGLAPVVVSGLGIDRWQYVNFTGQSGIGILQCVNGTDPLQQFDGTSWTVPVITGLPNAADTNDIINIGIMQQRLWYVMKGTTIAAYMPVEAILGPIGGFVNCGPLWRKGGYLVAVAPWTIDGGQGPQNYSAFFSSEGEVTIFSGTDPAFPNSWSLVGTFSIAPPIGYRCVQQIGSDVAIITLQGVLPISQVLPFDPSADRSSAITARIQNAMAQAAQQAKGNFGWQIITFPAQQLVILNVPLIESQSQTQFVMNALTGAWCSFTGWNANCFEVFENNLYFGDNIGNVVIAYAGTEDFNDSVIADMQCAYNWLDEPGKVKRMTMLQPLLVAGSGVSLSLTVDTDFVSSNAVAPLSIIQLGALWDQAIWDASKWSSGQENLTGWISTQAIGHAFAVRLRVNIASIGPTQIGEFDVGKFDSAVFDGGFTGQLPILQANAFNSIFELGGAI